MSVDTEKPSVQSSSTETNRNGNQHHRSKLSSSNSNDNNDNDKNIHNNKSNASTASTKTNSSTRSISTTNTASSRMTATHDVSPSLEGRPQELAPPQLLRRSQTPPPPPSSEKRRHLPAAPESPRASYFRRIREQQERAMERFFQTTIDAPCYALEEQIEYLTRCQQPKEFWNNMFHHGSHESDTIDGGAIPMGMYVVPQYCEYCGASNTRLCPSTCQRPKLFFRKKRPPFCNQLYEWDAVTEYQMEAPSNRPLHSNNSSKSMIQKTPNNPHPSSQDDWVLGMFHHHHHGDNLF